MNKQAIIAFILFSALQSGSMELIGGHMNGEIPAGEYLVTETILVMEGEKLTILPDSKLYFEQFSGIRVSGEFLCRGTASNPVILTSKKAIYNSQNDSPAQSFDWNGVEIDNDAKSADIANTFISHCTFGVQVKSLNACVRLTDVTFNDIGYSSVCRNAKLIDVKADMPFNISWNPDLNNHSTHPLTGSSELTKQKKNKKVRLIFLAGTGSVALGGGFILLFSSILSNQAGDLYKSQTDPSVTEHYRRMFYRNRKLQYTGAALLFAGMAGAGLSFVF